ELPLIVSAQRHFTAGSRARSQTQPMGMLDAHALGIILRHAGDGALENPKSLISSELGDRAPRGTYEHLRSQALAVAGALRSSAELAERHHRLGRIDDALEVTRVGMVQGFLDAAALGQLFAFAGAPSDQIAELDTVHAELARVAGKNDDLKRGRNPAGYLPSYVPLLYAGASSERSNFDNIYDATNSIEVRGAAETAEANAEHAGRSIEASAQKYANQRLEQTKQYELQMLELCGSLNLNQCGSKSGAIFNARSEITKASLRIKQVQQSILNIESAIAIENNRLAAQTGIIHAEIEAIREDGRRSSALHDQ